MRKNRITVFHSIQLTHYMFNTAIFESVRSHKIRKGE